MLRSIEHCRRPNAWPFKPIGPTLRNFSAKSTNVSASSVERFAEPSSGRSTSATTINLLNALSHLGTPALAGEAIVAAAAMLSTIGAGAQSIAVAQGINLSLIH